MDFGGIVRVAGVDDEAGCLFGGLDGVGSDPAGGGPHFQHVGRADEPVLLPRRNAAPAGLDGRRCGLGGGKIQSALAATNSAICASDVRGGA